MQAGTYSSSFFEPRPKGHVWAPRYGALTYTVPEGWAATSDFPESYGLLTQDAYATADPTADGCSACPDGIGVWATPQAAARNCTEAAAQGVGTSAADLAQWLGQAPGIVASEPGPVTIDGHTGIVVDLEVAEGTTGKCGEAGVPLLYNGWHMAVAAGDRQRFIFVDLGGGDTILILIDTLDPQTLNPFVAQAMPIVESFQFPPR